MSNADETEETPFDIGAALHGFDAEDFALLKAIDAPANAPDADLTGRIKALWAKADRLFGELGAELFGDGGCTAALWPDDRGDEQPAFLWARLKRAGNERFAAHIGVFLSPGFCNLSIDLEKDPLDAGEAAETVGQVVDFYRRSAAAIRAIPHDDARVWTDTKNIVFSLAFASIDFDRFMADNHDADHPWPKVGYTFSAAEVEAFGADWVASYRERAAPLVPIYDALIASYSN